MPLVRLTYPRGALGIAQKRQIAEALTEIVLDAEVDAVTEPGRLVTVVHFHEVAADEWAVAGELGIEATKSSHVEPASTEPADGDGPFGLDQASQIVPPA